MGVFDFFKKTKKHPLANLSLLRCDIHSHLIPEIDDGAKSIEDSINLISELHKLGFNKIITTPHIMSDYFKNTPEIIHSGLEKVRKALKEANINIEVNAAAEYYLDYDFERKLKTEELLTFGDKYLLFEISYLNPPDNIFDVIFKMQTLGYKPVLAHPERYNYYHRDFKIYESFVEKGVLLQLNINSLTGHYSEPTKRIAQQLIEKNMISMIGTDCHHAGHVQLLHKALSDPYLIDLVENGNLLNTQI